MCHAEHTGTHPVVQEVFQRRRFGLGNMQTAAHHISLKGGRGLGVGAASGELELLRLNVVSTFDLYDVTPQLIDAASRAATEQGFGNRVRCHVADVNGIELPRDSYDLITFISSLHHVEQLEHVLGQCYGALRPGGVLYAQEYVGPSRFAFPPDHVELARKIYRTLDPALRCGQPDLPVPDPLAVAEADPTESVRSAEIIGVCRRVFPAIHIIPEDVCLTLILWYGLNYDTLYDTQAGHDLVSWLLEVDQALVRSGRLPAYHVEILARRLADTSSEEGLG